MDECGRGPLAGPLVASAVVLNSNFQITSSKQILNDSKKLNSKQREKAYEYILKSGAIVEVEMISVRQINSRGIGWANKEIFRRLIKKIEAEEYIVDGNLKLGRIKGKTHKVKCLVKADATEESVMAASIIAKVTRDKLMTEMHNEFPNYGWSENAGYGTKKHIEALKRFGATKHHRDIFVRTALKHQIPNTNNQINSND